MHEFIQSVIGWYFEILGRFGLGGVFVLMAMESTVLPVPSEFVVPPAAYLESHAKQGGPLLVAGVIVAATLGSYAGSALMYVLARVLGRPFIVKYGKYFFIPEHKLRLSERWVAQYGATGIFFGRLLPVVRHLISIPAGICGMRFRTFTLMTLLGSFIWCTVLTVFGLVMAGEMQTLFELKGHFATAADEAAFEAAFHKLTWATVGLLGVAYGLYLLATRRQRAQVHAEEETGPVCPVEPE